jgi:hypothetical protein
LSITKGTPHDILHIAGKNEAFVVFGVATENFRPGPMAFHQEGITVVPEMHSPLTELFYGRNMPQKAKNKTFVPFIEN